MTDDSPTTKPTNTVPPPPRARRGLMVAPPPPSAAPDNLARPNAGLQDMNFKMDPDFHRAFKVTATMRGMAMKELLEASFRCWVEIHGDDTIKAMLRPK